MFFTAEDNALVDEIFALELAVARPANGEDAILLSSVTQPELLRRVFYLSASAAFRESYLADLKRCEQEQTDIVAMIYAFLSAPAQSTPETDAILATQFQDAEKIRERYPLLFKTVPPLCNADAKPPIRSMEFRLRLSMMFYSPQTRAALAEAFAALKEAGTTPLQRQAEILAQLEGYRSASVAEAVRQEAMLDLAYGDEESLCGGEL